MTDFVILQAGEKFPWTLRPTREAAEAELLKLQLTSADFDGAQILPFDEFWTQHESSYLDTPVKTITAEEFDDMLNVLPPLDWHTTDDGVNVFCLSEFTSGQITAQFGRRNGQFRCKNVRYRDRSTYLTAADFQ